MFNATNAGLGRVYAGDGTTPLSTNYLEQLYAGDRAQLSGSQMVAASDDVHAAGGNFIGHPGCDAGAASGVLAVGDDEVERVLFAEPGSSVLTA